MMRPGRSRRSVARRPGQTLVEAVLVLPVLLLVIIGGIECYVAFHIKNVVTDTAREGARQAVVQNPSLTPDSIKNMIVDRLSTASISPGTATVQFDTLPPPSGHWRETGGLQTMEISVPYTFSFLGPLIKAATGTATITIGARITMRTE